MSTATTTRPTQSGPRDNTSHNFRPVLKLSIKRDVYTIDRLVAVNRAREANAYLVAKQRVEGQREGDDEEEEDW